MAQVPKRNRSAAASRTDRRAKGELLDLLFQVVRRQVPVELGRHPRVLVAHDPLDGGQVGPAHAQQGGRRWRRWWKRMFPTWPMTSRCST